MPKKSVQIRLSQFITTYGVGSLVEIPDAGPCIVLGFEHSSLFTGGKEPNDFLSSDPDNSRVHEHKLDFAWIYHSANKKSSVYMHISFNLDELDEDPGDGGGITYQSTF